MDHGEMSTKETTTLKLIPGYENVMELEQRRQELKAVAKRMENVIGEKEIDDLNLTELIEFEKKLEDIQSLQLKKLEKIPWKDMIQPAKDLVVLNEYVKFKIGEMQARISMPQNDEFDIKMEVGKKEDLKGLKMRMKVFIGEKESEDIHLEELIEFSKKLEALHPKIVMHLDDMTEEIKDIFIMKEIVKKMIAKRDPNSVPPFKPSKEGDPELETFKEPNLDSTVRFGFGEELRVSSTPLDAMDHQSPSKDSESVVANQSDLKEPLDIYLRDSFNYVGSFRHVSVAAEPSVKESESVVSEPFVSDSSISCHTEVNMRDDHQKHKGEQAKKKTLNDEIVSLSSCRRAEEKKCDDEEDKEGVDKSVDDSLSTEEATMSKELASVPFVNIAPNAPPLPNLNLQIHPQPHLGGRVRKEQP
ncbi:hypothetical protein AXX17_AT5G44770 [Arabidopsis thaliana]|uniref:Uncharacterized protein n=1 Tax=Arabidopsis thaliana TaxID=3702 RepID=A0A178UE65_ARATH|nr:hypothetical protein AXX17_AT5G44770 [Arabidopsis thaliana]